MRLPPNCAEEIGLLQGHFLSAQNPIANADQIAGEDQAMRLWARPDVQSARKRIAFLWGLAYGADAPTEMRPSFDAAIDEYAFNYVLKAAASDAGYPRILRTFMPAYRWFGRNVPAPAWAVTTPTIAIALSASSTPAATA